MSSTSTLLKGIYLRPSVQPLGFSEQTSAGSLQAGSTSLLAGSRLLQADTGSPQAGSTAIRSWITLYCYQAQKVPAILSHEKTEAYFPTGSCLRTGS